MVGQSQGDQFVVSLAIDQYLGVQHAVCQLGGQGPSGQSAQLDRRVVAVPSHRLPNGGVTLAEVGHPTRLHGEERDGARCVRVELRSLAAERRTTYPRPDERSHEPVYEEHQHPWSSPPPADGPGLASRQHLGSGSSPSIIKRRGRISGLWLVAIHGHVVCQRLSATVDREIVAEVVARSGYGHQR